MRTADMKDVRVEVADDALLALDSPRYVDGIPQLEGENRSRIESIASANHEQDGLPALITQEDID
jgi:hypothetical protein